MRHLGLGAVLARVKALKHQGGVGMAHRLAGLVGQEVLLGHIGDIAVLVVFGQEVVKWLVLAWPYFFGNGLPPLLGIVEGRIDIENHAAKGEDPVLDYLADRKFGESCAHAIFIHRSLAGQKAGCGCSSALI